MLYTSLENIKNYLDINGNAHDNELTELISVGTDMIDIEIGQNLGQGNFTRRIDGSGSCRFVMERSDISTITMVRDIRTGSTYSVDMIDGAIVYLTRALDRGRKNIEVQYTAGYTSVPKDLELYFLEYCKALWNARKSDNEKIVKSKKIGDLSVTYFSPSELASESLARPEMDAILRKYKNFQFSITQ